MPAIKIKPDVYWVGVNDRTTDLFEGLWPIASEGVTYNSYLIDDEKKALIDLTKALKGDEYFSQINSVADLSQIDYVVINHMEPDHSGLIRTLRKIAPRVVILGSTKTKQMLASFFGITENVQEVKDGDTLSLGKRTLKFISTPFLHWPETIMTYETTRRILFPCDAFGGYGAFHGAIFDDDCKDFEFYKREALRYYVNVVANYSARVLTALDRLADFPIDVIAPSHGLVWRRNVQTIIELYRKWAGYAEGKGEPAITLIYGSMYGGTEEAMNAVAQGITRADVPLKVFDASRTHASYILPSLWTGAGVMIGAPTYEVALFPPVAEVLRIAAHKHIKNKKAAFFGSYGWSGGALKGVEKVLETLKWELTETFEFQGFPTEEDLRKAEDFGESFAQRIRTRT